MRSSTQIFIAGSLLVSACLACDQLIVARAMAADAAVEEKAPAAAENNGEQAATEAQPKKVRLAHIAIKGQLPESPGQMTLFGDLGTDLRKTIARLDKAADDDKIAGIILEIRPAALARGKLNELSAAIHRVRGSGKKVYAHLETAMGSQYVLATACDEIVMPESGVILIPGIHAELGYYKDMLEKLGIEADILHVGDAKGAAEPYTRRNMSEPVKKNLTALVDDLFDQMVAKIASNRSLKVDEVRALVDKGLLRPEEAREAGLIDRVAYPDSFRESLSAEYDADKLVYVMNYAKKKIDSDFSGPMGMIKLFQAILGGGDGDGSDKGPKIAIVYAVGPIMSGKSENNPFAGQVMGSDTIVKALHKAADDDAVKAIVLRVNSPGGSALASDLIWRATQVVDKPIVASMGDVAGSGGYYIAMGADRIVAEPGTITGSIGVVGGKFNMSGLFDKIGITTDLISRGKNSGMFSSTSSFSESEREVVSEMMHDVYRLFTNKAAEGRKMPLDKLEELAGGQVYTGRDAKRNGLVDQLGTLKDAIQLAKQLAGLDPDEKAKLRVLPEPENPFDAIFGVDSEAEKEVRMLAGLRRLMPELTEPLQRAAQMQRILRDPVALMMPFWIEIK